MRMSRYKIIVLVWLLIAYYKIKDFRLLKPVSYLLYLLIPYLYKKWIDKYSTDNKYFSFLARKSR